MQALLTEMPGASVVVEDLVSGRRWEWNTAGAYYYIASVYKLRMPSGCSSGPTGGRSIWDEEITYTADLHVGAAGIIQDGEYGDRYTVRQLIEYMIVYSDNTALSMLKSRFPVSVFKEWINSDEIGLERDLNDSTDSVTTAADCCTFARLAFQYMGIGGRKRGFLPGDYTSTDDQLFQSDLEVGQSTAGGTTSSIRRPSSTPGGPTPSPSSPAGGSGPRRTNGSFRRFLTWWRVSSWRRQKGRGYSISTYRALA